MIYIINKILMFISWLHSVSVWKHRIKSHHDFTTFSFSKEKMSCNKMKAMTSVSCWKCDRLFKIHRNTCSEDFDEPNCKWMYVSHSCNFSRIIHSMCYWIRIQIDSKCIMCFKKCARNLLAVFNWNKEAFSSQNICFYCKINEMNYIVRA